MSGFGAAHGADASTDEVLRWAREYGRRLIEEFAEGLRGARSVRRTERRQGDLQLARGDSNVPGRCEEFVQQRSSFLVGSGVVTPQERKQIAFSADLLGIPLLDYVIVGESVTSLLQRRVI